MSVARKDNQVLFVVMQSEARANGGVVSISMIMNNLLSFHPVVLTQLDSPATQQWRDQGIQVHILPLRLRLGSEVKGMPAIWQRLCGMATYNVDCYRLVRKLKCRLVHINDIFGFMHTGLGARLAQARVLINVRGTSAKFGKRWALACRLCHAIVGIANELEPVLRKVLPSATHHKIRTVYNSVEKGSLGKVAARRGLGIPESQMAIGVVSKIRPLKNQVELIRRSLPDLAEDQGFHFYFVGDFDPETDQYSAHCVDAATQAGIQNRVTFTGVSDQPMTWFAALDLTIVASRHEALSRAMIESLSCGTPVVSFAVCGAREILVQHECGLVVDQGDYAGLVTAIRLLKSDPELRNSLGRSARRTAQVLFNPRAVADSYEAIYQSLLDHRLLPDDDSNAQLRN